MTFKLIDVVKHTDVATVSQGIDGLVVCTINPDIRKLTSQPIKIKVMEEERGPGGITYQDSFIVIHPQHELYYQSIRDYFLYNSDYFVKDIVQESEYANCERR